MSKRIRNKVWEDRAKGQVVPIRAHNGNSETCLQNPSRFFMGRITLFTEKRNGEAEKLI